MASDFTGKTNIHWGETVDHCHHSIRSWL